MPPSIGPGRYKAFKAERSSRLFGLSFRQISRIPPDSNWNIASVRPEPNNCIVFASLSEVLAQSRSVLSARFMLSKQSLMMVSVLSARKSIFKTPTFSRSDISYWVVTSSLLLTAIGISSCKGFGVITTPAAWTEEWRAQPSKRRARSITCRTFASVSIALPSSGTCSTACAIVTFRPRTGGGISFEMRSTSA